MIFVDTSAWFAAYVTEDPDHAQLAALVDHPTAPLLTTDYVIDELITLLVARRKRRVAKSLGPLLLSGRQCDILWVTGDDVDAAWRLFDAFDDKSWSFTDFVSYAVMKRLGITEALSLDDHFRQFGFASVLP